MLHPREILSTCPRLFLVGLLASCAALEEPAGPAEATTPGDPIGAPDGIAGTRDAFAVTENGVVRGIATETTREFRGIPYAAAPVGDLRWRAPVPHERWHTVLDATQFANHCPQIAGPFGQASITEDCLFLNVFTPDGPDARDAHGRGLRPVMVWIHGGALITGESDDYDATRLVTQGDVIVVTINYRLGALGFLAHPALTGESPDHISGNYGLLDQQAALRWVQRNIVAFGGDPERVTIFGESAGGLSVHFQLASPTANGLFQRAIVESGAYQLAQPSVAAVEAVGAAFATRAGCTDQTAACLRGLSVEQVLANQDSGIDGATPVIDGKFLPRSIGAAFASGQFNRVPVMEGSNRDEWRLFVGISELVSGPVTAATYPAAIQATLGVPAALVPLFVAQYPLAAFPSPDLAVSALGTDAIFDCNARFAAQQLSRSVPTFAYEFADENAPERFLPPVSFPYGAAHASEIQYVFDLPVTVPAPAFDADQQQLAAAMVDYWTSFARTGDPSSAIGAPWAPFQAATDTLQSLVPPGPRAETSFAADHRCAFWDSLRR